MVLILRKEFFYLIAFALFLSIFMFSCAKKNNYTGTYVPHVKALPEYSETSIELKENGIGNWRIRNDEVSFRWDVRGEEIRLHTKSGGVIVGKIQGNTLEIALQDRNIKYYKRVK